MGMVRRGVRSALRSPLRLLLVGVLLGTSLMCVAALLMLNTNAQAHLAALNSELGTDVIISQVAHAHLQDFTAPQLTLAQQTPGVTHVAEEVYRTQDEVPGQPLHLPERPASLAADGYYAVWWGLSPGLPLHGRANVPAQLTSGRTFTASESNADVVLLSVSMAQANHLHLGSVLSENGSSLTVIGLFTTGTTIGDLSVTLPVQTAERVLHAGITYLILYAGSSDQVPALVTALHLRMGSGVNVASHANDFAGALAPLRGIARLSQDGDLAALVVSTLIIVFTVLLTLRERTQEISILKALGASNLQVIGQFGMEVLTMSLLASLVAALLLPIAGPWFAHAMNALPAQEHVAGSAVATGVLTITLTPHVALLLLSAAITLAGLSSALPAWYVARLKPSHVLRAE